MGLRNADLKISEPYLAVDDGERKDVVNEGLRPSGGRRDTEYLLQHRFNLSHTKEEGNQHV